MEKFRLTNSDIGDLCLALAHLLRAGIGVGDALYLLAEDEERPNHRALLRQMAEAADGGLSLAAIVGSHSSFPEYMQGLLLVGEKVGRVPETLDALAQHYAGRARMERRLRAALLYPAVLTAVLLVVVGALLMWVLPVFNDVYAQMGSRLTGIAGGLLTLGRFLRAALPWLCGLTALLVAALWMAAICAPLQKRLMAWWNTHMGSRGIGASLQTARFAQALAMAMQSGMTGEEAVTLASALAQGSPEHQARCRRSLEALEQGASLPMALREQQLLPGGACRLLEAGARSGSAEVVMAKLAEDLLEESEAALEQAAARVEPMVVVVLSLLVGAILFSVLLPLANILSAIG